MKQLILFREIIEKGLSVRDTEERARESGNQSPHEKKQTGKRIHFLLNILRFKMY